MYVDDMLVKEFIQESESSVWSSVLFVKKSNEKLRLCMNYWGLNVLTVKNCAVLSQVESILNQLFRAKIFIKLNLKDVFNLIWIAEEEKWKTVFKTQYELFEYLVMLFELINASAFFQILVNNILWLYLNCFVNEYVNDIIIYSEMLKDHVHHVQTVLTALQEVKLFIQLFKCEFHKTEIEFLEYWVEIKEIFMNFWKMNIIISWPTSKTIKNKQSFLSLINYYWCFIMTYEDVTESMTQLLQKDMSFHWDKVQDTTFQKLKNKFLEVDILTHYDSEKEIMVEIDVSDFVLIDCLSQQQEKKELWKSVMFHSKKFTSSELNYEIYNKKMLTIVFSLKIWWAFLKKTVMLFTIYTDHQNLEYFKIFKVLNHQQVWWSELLESYNFKIVYHSEK